MRQEDHPPTHVTILLCYILYRAIKRVYMLNVAGEALRRAARKGRNMELIHLIDTSLVAVDSRDEVSSLLFIEYCMFDV